MIFIYFPFAPTGGQVTSVRKSFAGTAQNRAFWFVYARLDFFEPLTLKHKYFFHEINSLNDSTHKTINDLLFVLGVCFQVFF